MCRLYGSLSLKSAPATRWLVESERSLLNQSNTSAEQAQKDGWGVGWYDARGAAVIDKDVGGAFEPGQRDRYLSAAARATGTLVIGHLRHASNPMGLTHEELIGVVNSQPFGDGNLLFAHNGAIPYPRETRPCLGRFESRLKGVNDSEVLFLLLARHLDSGVDPLEAYARTVADLWEVWMQKDEPASGPYSGLNVLLAPGPDELWAFCNWHGEHGTGFLDGRPYYQMTYTADPFEVVIGSEPFDARADDWKPIPNAGYVHAARKGSRIELSTGWIPIRRPVNAGRVP
ncbi:MAG: class II glutamine amidotransferase [Thermoplasmata archaeon]|nr:class II glutamine amidotransferase [Thermoplasmata archaeon]